MLFVSELERTQLSVFLFCRPTKTAPGKADEPDNDKNNADDAGWFHRVRSYSGRRPEINWMISTTIAITSRM